jgi:metal-responsive CopG/Arc/MetJ family transcriptional regulator
MSDRNHTNESTFQVHIDKTLLSLFDKALKKLGYKNRADWTREKIRETINKAND